MLIFETGNLLWMLAVVIVGAVFAGALFIVLVFLRVLLILFLVVQKRNEKNT